MQEAIGTDPQLASPTPRLSACCLAEVRVWCHHREERAGETTSLRAICVCSQCKGPADGSRPEEWSAFPWHLIRRREGEGA